MIYPKVYKSIVHRTIFSFCGDTIKKQEVSVELFSQFDIRVGKIIECWKHPQSENLYCEKIQLRKQPEIIRFIGSGLQKLVPLEKMQGNVLIMANLKARKLVGFASQGMVLCATSTQPQNDITCWPLFVQEQIGERVYLEGHKQLFSDKQILKALNPKKKLLEKCLPHFKTDSQGFATWNGIKLKIMDNYIRSPLINSYIT